MANDPLDLWPAGIQLNPLTPLKILKIQADRLKEKTQGLLLAEVVSRKEPAESDWVAPSGEQIVHRFEIVAPQLKDARYQLFICTHDSKLVYPVYVEEDDAHDISLTEQTAASQDEFTAVVRKLLSSKKHLGLLSSLLARISESDPSAVPA